MFRILSEVLVSQHLVYWQCFLGTLHKFWSWRKKFPDIFIGIGPKAMSQSNIFDPWSGFSKTKRSVVVIFTPAPHIHIPCWTDIRTKKKKHGTNYQVCSTHTIHNIGTRSSINHTVAEDTFCYVKFIEFFQNRILIILMINFNVRTFHNLSTWLSICSINSM